MYINALMQNNETFDYEKSCLLKYDCGKKFLIKPDCAGHLKSIQTKCDIIMQFDYW